MSFQEFRSLKEAQLSPPQGHELAGDEAENQIAKYLQSASQGRVHIFKGKRVPRFDSRGRYEIDIILLTQKHLYVLEIKNFTGSLVKAGETWVQVRRSGEQVTHEDSIHKNQLKLEAISRFLSNFVLPKDFIQQRVLFYKELTLSPEIKGDSRVVTSNQIESFLPKKSLFKRAEEQFLSALIHFLVKEEEKQAAREAVLENQITENKLESVGKSIRELRTWDEVCLFGGQIIRGDAYSLHVEGKRYPLQYLEASTGFSCKWSRSRLVGFYKAIKGKPLGTLKTQHRSVNLVPSEEKLQIHRVGQPKPEYIYLKDIEWFTKG